MFQGHNLIEPITKHNITNSVSVLIDLQTGNFSHFFKPKLRRIQVLHAHMMEFIEFVHLKFADLIILLCEYSDAPAILGCIKSDVVDTCSYIIIEYVIYSAVINHPQCSLTMLLINIDYASEPVQ